MGNKTKTGTTRQTTTPKQTPNDMLTRKEAAAVLKVSLSSFDRYVRGKRINRYESATGWGRRTGRRGPMYFFRRGELDALATVLKAPANKQKIYLDILTRALDISRTLLKVNQQTLEQIPKFLLADKKERIARIEDVDADIAKLERETALYFGDVKRAEVGETK